MADNQKIITFTAHKIIIKRDRVEKALNYSEQQALYYLINKMIEHDKGVLNG